MEKSLRGFTLMEISLVLIIVGLIIGGILVGQNLIEAAAIRGVISQVTTYSASVETFRQKYNCLPGSCANATSYNLGTVGGPGDNGNGSAVIYTQYFMFANDNASDTQAFFNFWYHLSQAGLVNGTYNGYPAGGFPSNTFPGNFTGYLPQSKMHPQTFISAATINSAQTIDSYPGSGGFGNAFIVAGMTTVNNPGNGIYGGGLTSLEASNIDTKLDDGIPTTGIVQTLMPFYGPRMNQGWDGCTYVFNNGFATPGADVRYDIEGNWANYAYQIPNTPPNPGQLGCLIAINNMF